MKERQIPVKEEGKCYISGSMYWMLWDQPSLFYEQAILDIKTFQGNQNTILGNIIHDIAERIILEQEVNLNTYLNVLNDPKNTLLLEDTNEVLMQRINLMKGELHQWIQANILDRYDKEEIRTEYYMQENVSDRIVYSGTADLICGSTLYDFKTCSSLPLAMKSYHIKQLDFYNYLLRRQNHIITEYKVVYISKPEVNRISTKTGKPLKDKTAQVKVISMDIDSNYMQDLLKNNQLLIDTVNWLLDNKNQAYIWTKNLDHKPNDLDF